MRSLTLVAAVASISLVGVAIAQGLPSRGSVSPAQAQFPACGSPQQQFKRILLPTLGGTFTTPQAVNDLNQVAGQADTATGAEVAFIWSGGELQSLGTLGGSFSAGLAINNRAQVVGISATSGDAATHGFVWQGGKMLDLAPLPGGTLSVAYGINDLGLIVGFSNTPDTFAQAVLWKNNVPQELGGLGGTFSVAAAINTRGQIVGWAATPSGQNEAFLWEHGQMTDLGNLGGSSFAQAINDRGEVAGWSVTASGDAHSFLWEEGIMHDLGTLGGANSSAFGINDCRQVVGWTTTATSLNEHAFLWQNGVTADLTSILGGEPSDAFGINHHGAITGPVYLPQATGYLLVPVGN
jgi:probable HAF family extracellular repeat protein